MPLYVPFCDGFYVCFDVYAVVLELYSYRRRLGGASCDLCVSIRSVEMNSFRGAKLLVELIIGSSRPTYRFDKHEIA